MQIFRYMVYIWERYEKEEERKRPGSTRKKDFQYPPIIPVVYYEGKRTWTAPAEFKDQILLGPELQKYIPNFSYYLVPICNYSDEHLIQQGDEISLIMLINKLQSAEDMEAFRKLPREKLEAIVKNTPEYLLDIIAKVLQAFLLKENVPEEDTEELIAIVKERKMGQLFANMEKMDIQEERRKTAQARAEAEQAIEKGIRVFILNLQDLGITKDITATKVKEGFELTQEVAWEKVNQYWKEQE